MADKEGFSELYKIVCSMLSRGESIVFRDPVNWKQMGLFDYPDIVKKPMDLGTVKSKLEGGKYSRIEDVAEDIRLVWSNCMLYNRDGSEYYHLADKFAKSFEESYAALRRLQDSKGDMDRLPTVEEKMQLSYDIFKISNADMGRVLTIIEDACPNALSRKVATDEVLVNFDALTPRCFHQVNRFALDCILSASGARKNKRKKTMADPPTTTTAAACAAEADSGSSGCGDGGGSGGAEVMPAVAAISSSA